MNIVNDLKNKIIQGETITREEAINLLHVPLNDLESAANEIREEMCGNSFDICTIVNGKSGKCSEDCKYCAQSIHYHTGLKEIYPLLDTETFLSDAKANKDQGVLRYSIVTSGRNLKDDEIDKMCQSIRSIKKNINISICISFGLLNENQFRKLKNAGANRVHCNLETSKAYFQNICTTHTYQDKINTIKAAKNVGLSVCSGGILGLGESSEDPIDMVLTARELGVKSIPVNILNPIPGTPFENKKVLTKDEVKRYISIFRFIIPDGAIRLAGGRGLLDDKGKGCFKCGANAAISGDMLTTSGITVKKDIDMIKKLGYERRLLND